MKGGYQPSEVASRGDAIYREQIKPKVGYLEKGTFVVIDIESGDYEIGPSDAEATGRLLGRRPSAYTWAVRVGYPAAGSLPSLWPPTRDA